MTTPNSGPSNLNNEMRLNQHHILHTCPFHLYFTSIVLPYSSESGKYTFHADSSFQRLVTWYYPGLHNLPGAGEADNCCVTLAPTVLGLDEVAGA